MIVSLSEYECLKVTVRVSDNWQHGLPETHVNLRSGILMETTVNWWDEYVAQLLRENILIVQLRNDDDDAWMEGQSA